MFDRDGLRKLSERLIQQVEEEESRIVAEHLSNQSAGRPITKDDLTNVSIEINRVQDVNDFLRSI